MEVEFRLEAGRREPRLILLAGERTPELERLLRELEGLRLGPLTVWEGERSRTLEQDEFLRFFTDGKGVSAQTAGAVYTVRLRLYELEERLDSRKFVRISNSEIVNLDRVTAVDLSLAGTIRMTLDGQVAAYASRRYVKRIKETLHLRGGRET